MKTSLKGAGVLVAILSSGCGPAERNAVDRDGKTRAVVFGADNRQEYLEVDDMRLRRWADATGGLIGNDTISCSGETCLLTASPNPLEMVSARNGSGEDVVVPLCDGQKFKGQDRRVYCSAFLVGPDTIATAGHCICGPEPGPCETNSLCSNLKIVFDFNADAMGAAPTSIPSSNVYSCVGTPVGVAHTGSIEGLPAEDWAFFQVDRPVIGRAPLLAQYSDPSAHHEFVSLGHPEGLPTKISRGALFASDDSNPAYFHVAADVFPGNSGGALVDVATGLVAGITTDASVPQYVTNSAGTCAVVNECDQVTGCPGFPGHTRMAWAAQQGNLPREVGLSQIAAVSWGSNRIDAFALGSDGTIRHQMWTGSAWVPPQGSAWESLGGNFHSPPTVVSWAADRLDLFVQGQDGNLYHKAWTGTSWSPSITTWNSLGGPVSGNVSAVAWGPDHLNIFALGTNDSNVYHKQWDGTTWSPSVTGWESLGGPVNSLPAAVSWGANRLDIVAVGTDGAMQHKAWTGSAWAPSMTGWSSLGGDFVGQPTPISWGANRLDIVALAKDGSYQHKAWTGSAWFPSSTGWEAMGGSFTGRPAAVSWGSNRIDVFGAWTDGTVRHASSAGTGWTSWEDQGGPMAGPAVVAWGSNRLDLYARGEDGNAYHKAWTGSLWWPSLTTWEWQGGQF